MATEAPIPSFKIKSLREKVFLEFSNSFMAHELMNQIYKLFTNNQKRLNESDSL
jgi:hypothetical protein